MTGVDSRAGWLTALAAFAAMFVAVGTGFSYGVAVLPVTRDLGLDHGTVSGVFAVTVAVFFLVGAPAGMLADRVGARAVLALGAVAMGAGLTVTATTGSAAGLYLGHGVLVGAAMSSTFVPLTAAVGALFVRHRSVAVGVAVSGIGVGTLVMAPLLAALIELWGWRRTYLVLAVVVSTTLLACAALARSPRTPPAAAPPLSRSLTTADFRVMYLAQLLVSVAVFTPFAHLPAFAESAGVAPVAAAGLVGTVGAASVVGRLALAPVADRCGLLATYRACYVAIGASFLLWFWVAQSPAPADAYHLLVAHAVLFGVGYGGFVALLPGVVAHRFGSGGLGGLLGVLYTSHVVGAGLGPLATGLVVARHGYLPAASAGLACALAGALLLGRLRSRVTGPAGQRPSLR